MYSLPELDHWRGCVGVCDVGGIFSVEVDAVLCENMMNMTLFFECLMQF